MKGKRPYLKKISAGILLIVLLFIHSVKLLHSHKYLPLCINHVAENSVHEIPGTDTISIHPGDCSVCAYHLNKNTDAVTSFQQIVFITYHSINSVPVVDLQYTAFSYVFETRGPPFFV